MRGPRSNSACSSRRCSRVRRFSRKRCFCSVTAVRRRENGLLRLPFRLEEEAGAVSRLLQRYVEVPMSLADGCLVRMSEQHDSAVVLTLDSDFAIYRRHRRQVVPTIRPNR